MGSRLGVGVVVGHPIDPSNSGEASALVDPVAVGNSNRAVVLGRSDGNGDGGHVGFQATGISGHEGEAIRFGLAGAWEVGDVRRGAGRWYRISVSRLGDDRIGQIAAVDIRRHQVDVDRGVGRSAHALAVCDGRSRPNGGRGETQQSAVVGEGVAAIRHPVSTPPPALGATPSPEIRYTSSIPVASMIWTRVPFDLSIS